MRPEETKEVLGELVEWQPPGGVVSVYVEIDPADRGEGWRIDLRDQLASVPDRVRDRVLAHFPENAPHPEGRIHIGFLAVDADDDHWLAVQARGIGVRVHRGPRPCVAPLVKIIDDAWPLGVIVVSLEAVRVFEWSLGRIEELDGLELEITSLDWRERKSPRRDPGAQGTGTTASGREQYMQRLNDSRQRFLKNAGHLIADRYRDRPWRDLILIGAGDRPQLLAAGLHNDGHLRVHTIPQDLISAPAAAIGARVEEELEHINRSREEALVAALEEAIGSDAGAALGPDEVVRALEEGRARHVIFDAERELEWEDGTPLAEKLIELAVATSAEVTPVEGLAAARLEARDGVAALLRY